jgi:hypothetical protein
MSGAITALVVQGQPYGIFIRINLTVFALPGHVHSPTSVQCQLLYQPLHDLPAYGYRYPNH